MAMNLLKILKDRCSFSAMSSVQGRVRRKKQAKRIFESSLAQRVHYDASNAKMLTSTWITLIGLYLIY